MGKYTDTDGADRYVVGDSALRVLREGMEVMQPYSDDGGMSRLCHIVLSHISCTTTLHYITLHHTMSLHIMSYRASSHHIISNPNPNPHIHVT